MEACVGVNGVFSVHEFMDENTQTVSVVFRFFVVRIRLETTMIKVRNVGFLFQDLFQDFCHRSRLANNHNSVVNINVLYMKEVQGNDR